MARVSLLRLAAASFLLLTAGAAGSTDIDPYWLEAIPAEYHGRWNTDARACAPFVGRGRIEISGQRLVAGGDSFEAKYVAWTEEGGIFVESRYVGPARPWTRSEHFTLSKDGTTLTGVHAGRKLVRRRCRVR